MVGQQVSMETYVHPVHTCVSRVRMRYLLPAPVNQSFLQLFPSSQVVINAFSRMVPGAKDHFTINNGSLHISGVIGESRLSVTYARRDEALVSALCELENFLTRAGFGHVTYGPITRDRADSHAQ